MSASVLIVDDDVTTCAGMVELLRHAGHDAQAATTFEDARAILARRTPDLLIVDIRLGEFNGLQLDHALPHADSGDCHLRLRRSAAPA